jgi:hypothetical protein
MVQQINIYNSSNYKDILLGTFSFLEPKENIEITTVCKTWNLFATMAFKTHFIVEAKRDLERKMAYMLSMTGKEVSDYCPSLKNPFADRETFSLKEIYQGLTNLTEKHIVFLNGFGVFYMEPDCFDPLVKVWKERWQEGNLTEEEMEQINTKMDIINKSKDAIYGRGFVRLTYKKSFTEATFCDGKQSACIVNRIDVSDWQCEGICFFPIELFNVKIQGENKEVIQIGKAEDCCLFLGGKLIEIIVIDEELWEISTPRHYDRTFEWETSPVTAQVPTLEKIAESYSAEQFYIPWLDSMPQTDS